MEISKTQRRKLELLYHDVKRISISSFKDKTKLDTSSKAGAFIVKGFNF